MKYNQIVKFIHHLQVFISIQLLIKVAWEASLGLCLIVYLLMKLGLWQVRVGWKGQNYFAKLFLVSAMITIFRESGPQLHNIQFIKIYFMW